MDLLKNVKKGDEEIKLLILGLDNAGKTTILKNLSNEESKDISPTQGFNVKAIVNDTFRLNLWDIGGQDEIRQYWKYYFEKVSGLVFVVDSSDEERVCECNKELKILLTEQQLTNVPLLVFANKQDLMGLEVDEIISKLELNSINERKWSIFACSAIKGEGLSEGMKWLVSNLKQD